MMELQEILLDFLQTVWRKEDMYYDAYNPKWHVKMVDDFITENGINLSLGGVMPSLLKDRRLLLKLSMQDVTNQTDISKATISRIERGNDAFFKTVMKLDKFYTENGA